MSAELRKIKDDRRKMQTRKRLMNAAERVFTAKGYHAALISDIVEKAGKGQGTFYRYFESKRDIFLALFERLLAKLLGEFDFMSMHMPSNESEYREASKRALIQMAERIKENKRTVLMFLHEGPSVDREFKELLESTYDRFAELAKFYLDHAIENGFARSCNSQVVSNLLTGMGIYLLEKWLTGRLGDYETEMILEETVEFAFSGIGICGERLESE